MRALIVDDDNATSLMLLKRVVGHIDNGTVDAFHDPTVFVTTPEEKGARAAALEAGATDLLTKPIDPAEVKARTRTLPYRHP